MKSIRYSKAAAKALRGMPTNVRERIVAKIEQYATNPASLVNNVTALKEDPGFFRLRVGDWRVLFSEEGFVIAVLRVAPRSSAYE